VGEDAVKTGDELLVAPVDGDTDDNLAAVSADLLPGLDPPAGNQFVAGTFAELTAAAASRRTDRSRAEG